MLKYLFFFSLSFHFLTFGQVIYYDDFTTDKGLKINESGFSSYNYGYLEFGSTSTYITSVYLNKYIN